MQPNTHDLSATAPPHVANTPIIGDALLHEDKQWRTRGTPGGPWHQKLVGGLDPAATQERGGEEAAKAAGAALDGDWYRSPGRQKQRRLSAELSLGSQTPLCSSSFRQRRCTNIGIGSGTADGDMK